jgi:hypothetical protein
MTPENLALESGVFLFLLCKNIVFFNLPLLAAPVPFILIQVITTEL